MYLLKVFIISGYFLLITSDGASIEIIQSKGQGRHFALPHNRPPRRRGSKVKDRTAQSRDPWDSGQVKVIGPIGPSGSNEVTLTGLVGQHRSRDRIETGPYGPDYVHSRRKRGTGVTDPQGYTGATGPVGYTGSAGFTGSTGPQGDTGSTGSMGPLGATGSTGPIGSSGQPGSSGFTGATGPTGERGTPGATGPGGSNGPPGPMGAAGPGGPSGFQGAQGLPGGNGSTGATGAYGRSGASGATGRSGPSGSPGPSGPPGSPGGATGPVGPQGHIGPTGPAGDEGETGKRGRDGGELGSTVALILGVVSMLISISTVVALIYTCRRLARSEARAGKNVKKAAVNAYEGLGSNRAPMHRYEAPTLPRYVPGQTGIPHQHHLGRPDMLRGLSEQADASTYEQIGQYEIPLPTAPAPAPRNNSPYISVF